MDSKILIVEDDPHFGQQLADLFEYLGHPTELVANGRDALAFCERQPIRLLLTDLMLPLMSGVEVVRRLRKLPGKAEVPVLMMSAVYKNPRLFEQELRELRVLEFLPKPFSLVDLGRKVAAILEPDFEVEAEDAHLTRTGSWRLEDLDDALGLGGLELEPEGEADRLGLLHIIVSLFREHEAGRLVLDGAEHERQLFFLNGYPVWAVSRHPGEDLGTVLVRRGDLTEQQVADLEQAARRDRVPWPRALAESGLVSEGRLLAAGKERVRYVLEQCFERASVRYQFHPGDTFVDRIAVNEINPVRVLGRVVERWFDGPELSTELNEHAHDRVSEGPRFRRLVSYLALPAALDGLVEAVAAGPTFGELRERYMGSVAQLDRWLWLMAKLGIVAFGAGNQGASVLRHEPDAWSSGNLPLPSFVPEEVQPLEPQPGTQARAIIGDYLALMERDFYEFLSVPRAASHAQIDEAYGRLKERFDLGRLGDAVSGTVRVKAKELDARLEVVYGTLSKPSRRAIYDESLARRAAKARAEAAERLADARRQLERGRGAQALALLRQLEAAMLGSAEVRALLGRAMLMQARGDRVVLLRAQDVLEHALQLEPGNLDALRALVDCARELQDPAEEAMAVARLRAVAPGDPTLRGR